MRIALGQNTFITPIDRYGKINNTQIIIFAKSGYGKGNISEGIVEWYHKHGYLCIVISDPKFEVEYGFQMFKPEEQYHLDHLKKVSSLVGSWKLPHEHDVKIYHPFSFNIPTNRLIPNQTIFTIPIKSLGRNEWGMLTEVAGENESISLLLKSSEEISNEDGIYSFAHSIQDSIKGKGSGKRKKADWKNFGLESSSGTFKELIKVTSALRPFKKHYFLAKENCPYNLDWKSILADQKNYHVFVSNYIGRQDEKVTDFLVLYLLESILRNKSMIKHPILIVVPELPRLAPYRPEGHKIFLANSMKSNFKTIRSEGRGISVIGDGQVWNDLEEDLRGSFGVQLFGELGDMKDVENLCKASGYKGNVKEKLNKADPPRSYLIRGIEEGSPDDGGYYFFYSTAMHKEESYNFEEMYRKHNRENPEKYPMMSCKEIHDYMNKMFKDEENKLREKVKRREKELEELEKQKELEKEAKSSESEKVEVNKEKVQEIVDKSKEKIMQLCYEMFMDESINKRERSFRKIGLKFGVDKKTAQKYIKKCSEKIKQDESKSYEERFTEMQKENEDLP